MKHLNKRLLKTLSLLSLTFLTIPSQSKAELKMLDCVDKGNKMSWHVSIDSELLFGSFSNNDHETALERKSIENYDIYSQPTYTFEGQDGNSKLEFIYNSENKSGLLFVNVGMNKIFNVKFNCEVVENYIDWEEVKKAIKDAPKNKGSTRY